MQKNKIIVWIMLLSGVLLLGGCDADTPKSVQEASKPSLSQQEAAPGQGDAATPAKESKQKNMTLIIYQTDKEALHLVPESHIVPFNDHPAQTALALLLAGTKNNDHLSVVPAGTELVGFSIKDHVAYVNFNDKLKRISGSTSEMLLVGAIIDTLTEFKDISAVQILINGKKVDTLTGHLDLSTPLSRDEQLIKNK